MAATLAMRAWIDFDSRFRMRFRSQTIVATDNGCFNTYVFVAGAFLADLHVFGHAIFVRKATL